MTARALLLLLLVLLPAGCATSPQTAEGSAERAVEQTFESYRRALLARDGAAAADLVTEQTWAFYRDWADRALTADRVALMESPLVDRVSVLLMRHGMAPAQLREMSGKEIFAHAVERGWISRDGTSNLRLTEYRADGSTAHARVVGRSGQVSDIMLRFVRQEGRWRLDVPDMVDTSRSAVALAVALSDMTQEEFLYHALEDGTGRRPGPEIWNPPS